MNYLTGSIAALVVATTGANAYDLSMEGGGSVYLGPGPGGPGMCGKPPPPPEYVSQSGSSMYGNGMEEGEWGIDEVDMLPCPPRSGLLAAGEVAAGAGAATSRAIGSAIGSAISARSGTGSSAARNKLFFSNQGPGDRGDTEFSIWASLEGRAFSGILDGDGVDLTFGADFEVGADAFVGLLLSYAEYDVTSAGVDFDSDGVTAGPYFTTQIGESGQFEAYLVYGEPDYDGIGFSYSSERTIGGVAYSQELTLGNMDVTGFATLDGFTEELPAAAPGGARTVRSTTLALGAQFNLRTVNRITPYVSLAAEGNRFDDGLGNDSTSFAPRLGAGFSAQTNGGRLNVDFDAGEVFDGARDVGVNVSYVLNF